ncbi:MAG: hypothetical protein H6721_21725 [Sandaracinus sp.]|nr:hypothetical protein [Sandaracinus sp.]
MSVVGGIRVVSLLGYLGVIAAAFVAPVTPRVFWTVIMPLVPLAFVVAGFHVWRRTCPIATVGSLGARLHRGRALPGGWRRRGLYVAFVALIVTLVARLVATNGDGPALGLFLAGLGLAAVVTNAWGGGRSFCHHLCPVGVVERIYTDDAPRAEQQASRCTRCTGCAPACADLDQSKAFARARDDEARRVVAYAFPGVVLAFYAYYALREGTWEAYFDGRWTEAPLAMGRVMGPGFHHAPAVPAVAAAAITLVSFAAISFGFFAMLERALAPRWTDRRVRRGRMLAFASFAAFNLFYLFAGAPTLRLVPGLARGVAFLVPVVATLVLAHRLRPSSEAKAATADSRGRRRLPVVARSVDVGWKEAG